MIAPERMVIDPFFNSNVGGETWWLESSLAPCARKDPIYSKLTEESGVHAALEIVISEFLHLIRAVQSPKVDREAPGFPVLIC